MLAERTRVAAMFDITLNHLTDAVPTALFGIFALWAASSRRHWFVRTAVVGSALLVLLLVPAYDVVVLFGCSVLFMLVALAIWRKRRQRAARDGTVIETPPRRIPSVSLATLMLVTVVVAVVTAVAARVPHWSFSRWLWLVGVGLMGGAIGASCVWIVCGRARWWVRLLAAPLLLAGCTVVIFVVGQLPRAASDWVQGVYRPLDHYWQALMRSAGWGISYWSRVVAIGMTIMVAWMFVVRRAGWFDPFGEMAGAGGETGRLDRGRSVARVAAVALFALVASLPLAILYRLALPPAIPALKIPEPNGWDDLMAAGKLIESEDRTQLPDWMRNSGVRPGAPYRPEAVARLRQGLGREIVNPYMYRGDGPVDQTHKLLQIYVAVSAYAAVASYSNDLDWQLDAYWDLLRLANETGRVMREPGRIDSNSIQWESTALDYYWPIRTRLSQEQCRDLLAKLIDYDKRRDTYEDKCARQRIVDANAHWEIRLRILLAEWSGDDPYRQGYSVYAPVIKLRLLITDLAVRAYKMQHGKLPVTLEELVPEFLPALPADTTGGGRIVYRKTGDGYKIYCTGPDADDDGGRAWSDASFDGDFTPELYLP
jgi:hypothetical protein